MNLFWLILILKVSLSFTELIEDDEVIRYVKSVGFYAEAHQVVTDDGYILRIHHIPPKSGSNRGGNKKPVFLMHSAFSSSLYYLNTHNVSMGFYFSEMGYDVWLGNVRGSTFSTAHKWLDTESLQFWKFSFHEMGVLDLPAMIDYTLQQTGFDRCFYIGHSQACTQLFAFLSLRPEYNDKIIQSHLFSPIGAMANPRFPLKSLVPAYFFFAKTFNALPYVNFGPGNKIGARLSDVWCTNGLLLRACQLFNFFLLGGDPRLILNPNTDPAVYRTIFPTLAPKTGVQAVTHYVQTIMSGEFRQFDYGMENNLKLYGSKIPPLYPLNKITSEIFLYAGKYDQIFRKKDTDLLIPHLQNVHYMVIREYNHIDFVFARDAREKLYSKVLLEFEKAE